MDIDSEPKQPSAPAMASSEAVDRLSEILAQLEETPENVAVILQAIDLMGQVELIAEQLHTMDRLSSLVILGENQWNTYFDVLLRDGSTTFETLADVLEKFDRAEQDYHSAAIICRHIRFLQEAGSTPDPEVAEFLTMETVREMTKALVDRCNGLLDESQQAWELWLEWEKKQSAGQNERIHQLYKDRLAVPHSNIQSTFNAYSTFCSANAPNDYEKRLVAATEASQPAKQVMTGERRYGRTRQDLEDALAAAADPASRGMVYNEYISWETDIRAKAPNPALTQAVFERAVNTWAHAASLVDVVVKEASKKKKKNKKGKGKAKEEEPDIEGEKPKLQAYRDAEAGVWDKYASWAASTDIDPKIILQRAVRACPGSGALWSRLLLEMEPSASLEDLTSVYQKALNLGVLFDQPDAADLFLHRASYESRTEPPEEVEGAYHPVMITISLGLEKLPSNPSCKLEKFLLEWAETRAPRFLDQALALVEKPSKARASSYQMSLLRAGIETRRGNIDIARQIFTVAVQRSDLDWPEVIYEAFTQFEAIHGTLESIADTRKLIEREHEKLNKRRQKAAQEQFKAAVQYQAVEQQYQTLPVDDSTAVEKPEVVAPIVTEDKDKDKQPARDREHTTILVTGLGSAIDSSRVESFFSDCGPVREVTMLSEPEQDTSSALIEFRRVEAVPAALARDRKKIDNHEVHISMLWRSTLFITNFPKDADDESIRKLLAPFGRIIHSRWPARKYADARRFCYVTMESPAAAQNALELHGSDTGTAFKLSVMISDPSAKAKRSDAGKTTLFVGGLTAQTTEADVKEQFQKYGNIHYIKLGYDPVKKICKGFAFVDMSTEAEAQAATALHGAHLNGKFLKVELSDPNRNSKKPETAKTANGAVPGPAAADKRSRSVRLHGLPEDTQEGLLQQALEKIVPVKRLEMFSKSHEAVAELRNGGDAGKLLLRTEPFVFNGATITFTEQGARKPPTDSATPLGFTPRNARKPGIGKGRQAPAVDKTLQPVFVAAGSANMGQNDFRAMVEAKNKKREANLVAAQEGSNKQEGLAEAVETSEDGVKEGIKRPAEEIDRESKKAKK